MRRNEPPSAVYAGIYLLVRITGRGEDYEQRPGLYRGDATDILLEGDAAHGNAPVVEDVGGCGGGLPANGDSYTVSEDTALTIDAPGVLSNDTDADPADTLEAVLVSGPTNGTGTDTLTGGADADFFSGGTGTDTATDPNAADGDQKDNTTP